MKINVKGFASEFTVIFPEGEEGAASAFTGALVDVGAPMTERETRSLALAFGGGIVDILPEHEALAHDLAALAGWTSVETYAPDSPAFQASEALARLAAIHGDA